MVPDYFNELVRQLAEYDVAVDEAFLHGLLTGYATIPARDSGNLLTAIAGERPLAESVTEAAFDTVDLLAADLSTHTFQARFDAGRSGHAKQWLEGYTKAVEIHEDDWQELNEIHPDAGVNLIMLHSMSNPKLHRDLSMDLPGPEDLKKHPQLVTNLVIGIYDQFHAGVDDGADEDVEYGVDLSDDESSSWLDFTDDELSAMDESDLMAIIASSDDILPREVVMESASRGDAMVQLLRQHLENESHWSDEADESDWWALLHAIFILGLIPGEAAARTMLHAFCKVTFDEDNNLCDWLSSCWPALCRNKTEFTTAPLEEIAENRELGWYARSQAVDCVLAAAAGNESDALERAVDWLAAMCGDAANDTDFRILAGNSLLDFPRERHRPVMEALADLQQPGSLVANAYTPDDVQHAFDVGDHPGWQRFDNPWRFYDPDAIDRRQERWLREAEYAERDSYRPINTTRPYQRTSSKVGRNDPCPCGSGKKYKKCCLNTLH